MKKKTALLLLQYAIFFGLGFALIYWSYNKLSPQDIIDLKISIRQVAERWWIVIPITIIGFLSHFFRALRWRLLLEPLQLRPTIVNTAGAVFIGYITNLLIPRMGEVAKCTVLAKYENEPVDKIIGTIVAERAFDFICLLIIAFLTFAFQLDIVSKYFQLLFAHTDGENLVVKMAIKVAALIAVILLLVFVYKRNKNGKIGKFIKGLGEGVGSIIAMKKRYQFISYTILIWASYLSLIYIGFWALPATEHLGIGAALSVLVIGSIGIILTPGGIGAYPPLVQLTLFQLYMVKESFGLAFGWISWLAQTLIIILFGLISFLILPIYNKNRNGQATVDTE
jgi:hypothetical protein